MCLGPWICESQPVAFWLPYQPWVLLIDRTLIQFPEQRHRLAQRLSAGMPATRPSCLLVYASSLMAVSAFGRAHPGVYVCGTRSKFDNRPPICYNTSNHRGSIAPLYRGELT